MWVLLAIHGEINHLSPINPPSPLPSLPRHADPLPPSPVFLCPPLPFGVAGLSRPLPVA